jgi:hypothetical protein
MQFWLGIHHPNWLERLEVPSMVSYRSLRSRKSFPRALSAWMQDSGGFSELSLHGAYTTSARDYAAQTQLHAEQIGNLAFAAVQDHMCEDKVLARTGASIAHHQVRTLESYLDLLDLAPSVPWMPVLQGQVLDDYLRHVDLYTAAGVNLRALPLVGVGTVCRRQHTMVAVRLLQGLGQLGLRLHGFGLKITALLRLRDQLSSGDSMAWSLDGRYPQGGRCKRIRDHQQCINCLEWALLWRERLMLRLTQPTLWEAT